MCNAWQAREVDACRSSPQRPTRWAWKASWLAGCAQFVCQSAGVGAACHGGGGSSRHRGANTHAPGLRIRSVLAPWGARKHAHTPHGMLSTTTCKGTTRTWLNGESSSSLHQHFTRGGSSLSRRISPRTPAFYLFQENKCPSACRSLLGEAVHGKTRCPAGLETLPGMK